VSEYKAVYEKLFVKNLKRYTGLRQQIKRRVDRIITNPYNNTELLANVTGQLDLTGCRSARIDRNFRLIFVICEECRPLSLCDYCFCDGLSDKTVVFLTIGPHDKAYGMR
jgi:mRNA-degrading endonuclease YafQ of YafQ-DinJ toxin-antitoxin module